MLEEESVWIKETLRETNISTIKDVLDIGSSTKEFRTQIQPYIDTNIFKPLRDKNKTIQHLDRKEEDGIDFVCDIEHIRAEDIGKKFDLIICCSLLEHVQQPMKACSVLMDIVKENGFLLITVPRMYRYHPDPVDTMFRPSMNELISMFPSMDVVRKDVIRIKDKVKYKKGELFRYLLPFLNWKVNCLFMRKAKS